MIKLSLDTVMFDLTKFKPFSDDCKKKMSEKSRGRFPLAIQGGAEKLFQFRVVMVCFYF